MAGTPATGTGTPPAETDDDFEDEEELDTEDDDKGAGDKPKQKKSDDDDEFDPARAKKTIENQRASEKKLKGDLRDLRAELKAIKDKDLPEAARQAEAVKEAEDRAEKAEAQLQKASIRTVALEEATKLGFRNPALAYRLIDGDEVDWDDDRPVNVKSLLKKLLEDDPYLKGRAKRNEEDEDDGEDADAGRGRGRKSKGFDMNAEIRSAAGR